MKFYKCDICGKIIVMMHETPVPTVCCGADMHELIPGSTDAATEKHVPVVTCEGRNVKVTVGSVTHPMLEKHYIEWILLETDKGWHKAALAPDMKPEAEFVLAEGENALRAYELCNLHSLWVKEL